MPEERLQKIIARCGYGSRRSCEDLIVTGRVKVNGISAQLGQKADQQRDAIMVDGSKLPSSEPMIYIALNKPRGVLADEDPDDARPTVRSLIPIPGHLFAVGRLDLDSEGLMLLTNDGELANRLTHPRYQHEKEYQVLVATRPDDAQLDAWRHGVVLEDGTRTLPAQVGLAQPNGKGIWLRVILKEGRKRQIREVGKRLGLPVVKIIRVRIGTLLLGTMKTGEWKHLSSQEIASLKKMTAIRKPASPERKRITGISKSVRSQKKAR